MALSIALPLSGLDADNFCPLGTRLLFEQGLRILNGAAPLSPSTGSESSGFNSLVPSIESSEPATSSRSSSRPSTPENEAGKEADKEEDRDVRVFYMERDILNLGANLREPYWQMRIPSMPRYDFRTFMENRSIYYRLGEHGLTEEYPTRNCKDCGFSEPSPYLF